MVASASAAAAIYWTTNPWLFPILIFLGGLFMMFYNRNKDMALKVGHGEGGKGQAPGVPQGICIFWKQGTKARGL